MAHKKAGSSSKNGRDSVGQRLGVKRGDGQLVTSGSIIVRQRGMTFLSGSGTGLGQDYTVFATVEGHVRFEHATKNKKRIRVLPAVLAAAEKPAPATVRKAAPAKATPPTAEKVTAKKAPAKAEKAARPAAPRKTTPARKPAPATAEATA